MAQLDPNQHFLRTALALVYGASAAYSRSPQAHAKFRGVENWSSVETFRDAGTDTEGFVAAASEHVVVAFRGTEPKELRDWITDLNYHQTPALGGKVHRGFWKAWRGVKTQVENLLGRLRTANQHLWITGHSLGGALATLAARDLAPRFKPVAVHTFGAPRVGDPKFAAKYKINLLRFINEDDIVPHVPFQGLINRYSHTGTGYVIQANARVTSDPGAWRRLLRKYAQVMIMGAGFAPEKAFRDHAIPKYIAKLEGHPLNR